MFGENQPSLHFLTVSSMTTLRSWPLPLAAAGMIFMSVGWFVSQPIRSPQVSTDGPAAAELAGTVAKLDAHFATKWQEAGVEPAAKADDLVLLRRISLALVGTVPSLEEIREFEADDAPERLQRWTARFISDRRFVDYFGFSLAGAFIDLRNDDLDIAPRLRFVAWIGEGIQQGKPWTEMAHDILASRGALADEPGAAMIAAEFDAGQKEAAERLAARTSRALLGQRIDCAQCHDHPFAEWTQGQFEGLAAHFSQASFRNAIIQDNQRTSLVIDDTRNNVKRTVKPAVPFGPDWVPKDGLLREQLAAWMAHPDNRRFRRAIANRMWGSLIGRPLVEPVDGLPDPPSLDAPDALDFLADELFAHQHDLRRLIHVIVASRVFQLDSAHPGLAEVAMTAKLEKSQAVFPVTELDAHQLIRSMQQAASVGTILPERESTYVQLRRVESRFRFAREYEHELADGEEAADTVPQASRRLTGNTIRNLTRSQFWTAPGRIAVMTATAVGIDQAYLAILSRRPTQEEAEYFVTTAGKRFNQRGRTLEDIYWTLFNSAEFCWNH